MKNTETSVDESCNNRDLTTEGSISGCGTAVRMKSAKDRVCVDIPESLGTRNHSHNDYDECDRYNDGYCRTFLAFLFVFLAMISNLIVLSIVHERVPMNLPHLPDLGFDLFPRADFALNIAEYIIVIEVTAITLLLFLHRYRQIIFRRIALIMGVLYLFRGICMISTVFPLANENYYCSPQLTNRSDPSQPPIPTGVYAAEIVKRVLRMFLGFGLSINGMHTYCGDYLYSGHTVTLTIGYLILREYLLPSRCRTLLWKLANILILFASFAGVIAIIISRGHYLIDILIAYYVTTRVFWIYHTLAYNHELMFASPTNYLSRVWWFVLFQYFECAPHDRKRTCETQTRPMCNCDTPVYGVPRSFEWPLPWPRSLRRRTLLPYQQRLLPATQA